MDVPNFNTNIGMEEVLAQLREEQENKLKSTQITQQKEFNPKKYLNVRLDKNEEQKQIQIRLLPFSNDGGSPFHKVHMHTVRVNGEVAPSGWKTITCAAKNNDLGNENKSCPFCETSAAAKQMARTSINEAEKKRYNDISYLNRANEMWMVRCIERGHEEDGVKFWLFPNPKNGGIYQTIMNIYKTRKEAGERRGEIRNIFDLNHGKDLIVTIKKGADGKKKIDVVDDDEFSPLTKNIEEGNLWINDGTKWSDLYPLKRVDYMSILVEGGVPYWDKEQKCYVDKETYQANASAAQQAKIIAQAEQAMECPIDYTVPQPIEESNGGDMFSQETKVTPQTQNNWEDDLPF